MSRFLRDLTPWRCLTSLSFFILLFSCSAAVVETGSSPHQEDAADVPRWYILEDGFPVPITRETLLTAMDTAPIDTPWTLQARVVGFYQLGEDLFSGINRCGFIQILPDEACGLRFRSIFDEQVFRGRTIGAFFPIDNSLGVHVYVNPILGSGSAGAPVDNLFVLDENETGYVGIESGRNPETWELTGIIPLPSGWNLSWRGVGQLEGTVEYEERGDLRLTGHSISASAFREGYRFLPLEEAPYFYGSVLRAIDEYFHSSPMVVHIHEMNSSSDYEEGDESCYQSGNIQDLADKQVMFLDLQAVRSNGRRMVLFPEGNRVFIEEGSGDLRTLTLPEPGESCEYGYLWPFQGGLILSWEQRWFSYTGRSGFLFIPSL